MTTQSQIDANRENAQSSTGPRTEAGKASSSQNARTLGLYTREDYVKPEERDFYEEFREAAYSELMPDGFLEESFASEITSGNWRLLLCSAAEAELTDFTEASDKTRRSIERARSHAPSVINRSLNQLRKLQTERIIREQVQLGRLTHVPVADVRGLMDAHCRFDRARQLAAKTGAQDAERYAAQLMNDPLPAIQDLTPPGPAADNPELASFCETDGAKAAASMATCQEAAETPEETAPTPRNAACPCNSGEKYKRCCGKGAPSVLGRAA